MGYWLLLLTTGLVGEAEDQPHIALRDHDGSDRGPGGGRLDAQTSRVARSDGEGRDLLYAVNDGAGWTIEAVDPPGSGLYFLRLQTDAQ